MGRVLVGECGMGVRQRCQRQVRLGALSAEFYKKLTVVGV